MLCSKRYYRVTVEKKCCPVSYCYCSWWHIFVTEHIMSFAGSGGYIDHSVTNIYLWAERVRHRFGTVFWPLVPELGLQRQPLGIGRRCVRHLRITSGASSRSCSAQSTPKWCTPSNCEPWPVGSRLGTRQGGKRPAVTIPQMSILGVLNSVWNSHFGCWNFV